MSLNTPQFITPPTDEQERLPFRPVWRSLLIESGILFGLCISTYTVFNLLAISIPSTLETYISITIVFIPLILWIMFSLIAETRVPSPRQKLFTVVLLTSLVANSIGYPIITKFFIVESWLPLEPAINRIIGYTLTVGITQELIKYLVIRFSVWPEYFRVRVDGVAFGIAAGIGYATVNNIQFVSLNSITPIDVTAFKVVANYALQISTGMLVGYGLSEVYFSNSSPIFQPIILLLGSIITGIAIPIHSGLTNTTLSISSVNAPRPLFGLGFSIGLLIIVSIIIAGLVRNADRLEQEAGKGDE